MCGRNLCRNMNWFDTVIMEITVPNNFYYSYDAKLTVVVQID